MAKVLVSIDDALLERLDGEARRRGQSRSAFLSQLAAKELGVAKGPGASPEARAAMRRAEELFRKASYADDRDSTVIIREMRVSR